MHSAEVSLVGGDSHQTRRPSVFQSRRAMAVRSPYAPAGPLPPGAGHSEPVPMVVSAHSVHSVCPDVTPVLSPAPPAAERAARGAGTLPGDPSVWLRCVTVGT